MTKFTDLNLNPKVLKAIEEAGYETPTPIQAGAIPPALEGRDVLGIAQTGTGKTASFTLPMITMLARGRARARMPRSLVLCPTRELAAQVAENFDTYTKHLKLTKALLIGGVSFKEQDQLIDKGVDVLIATPGRLLDHFERGKLLLTGVQIMVVDEADRMLDMGFIPDIERIVKMVPFTRQTLFFSATMPPVIEKLADQFLQNPVQVAVAAAASTSENIEQKLVKAPKKDFEKRAVLRDLIDNASELKNGIVFCNRKRDVAEVYKSLRKRDYSVGELHGDMDQTSRTRTLDGFRGGDISVLVASDVAARGLDIPDVSHVFNYDVPSHAEDYVHRIGRCGRAGRDGWAFTLVTPSDDKYLKAILDLTGDTIEWAGKAPAPTEETGEGRKRRSTRKKTDDPKESKPEKEKSAAGDAPKSRKKSTKRTDEKKAPKTAKEQQSEPKQERPERSDRPKRGRGKDGDDGNTPKGLGDHVPSFLTQSVSGR